MSVEIFNDENVNTLNVISAKLAKEPVKLLERKSLQVLQQTPDNRLTRKGDQLLHKKTLKSSKKPFTVFKDTPSPKTNTGRECVDMCTQTDACYQCSCPVIRDEDEALRLMGNEQVPEDYWKELAETRKQALDDSLLENEILTSEVDTLRQENTRLSELAQNAEYFAKILKELTDNKGDGEHTDSDAKEDGE